MGDDAGRPCPARPGLAALDTAVHRQLPAGARAPGVSVLRDHGCPPTALACMKACRTLGMQQAFTSDNHPTGQAETERVMRTRTEECLWRQEWTCPFQLMSAFAGWIDDDNEHD